MENLSIVNVFLFTVAISAGVIIGTVGSILSFSWVILKLRELREKKDESRQKDLA